MYKGKSCLLPGLLASGGACGPWATPPLLIPGLGVYFATWQVCTGCTCNCMYKEPEVTCEVAVSVSCCFPFYTLYYLFVLQMLVHHQLTLFTL